MIEHIVGSGLGAIIVGVIFYVGVVFGRALSPDQECPRQHRDE